MDSWTGQDAFVADDESPADRRGGERHVKLFRLARVADRHGDDLALVRNISGAGAQIETEYLLHEGDRITIELRSDKRAEGIVRWSRSGAAGIAFKRPIDVKHLLESEDAAPHVAPPRFPRFARSAHASVSSGQRQLVAPVSNISLAGVRMAAADRGPFRDGDQVVVHIEGLDPREARIRWSGNGALGVQFDRQLSFRALEHWLRVHASRD